MRQPEGGFSRRQVLVTCEHASNDLPRGLELDPDLLQLHIAYDPGAAEIARLLATEFRAPLHCGKYSRLVVDLNRTVGNRNLIRTVTDGHRILFNYGLSESDRRRRIERYYRPYRRAVARDVARIVAREGRCIHLCIHTYAPELAGKLRRNDIGILYDPERQPEAAAARQLRQILAERTAHAVWLNRPYSGTADGILPAIRLVHPGGAFVGIELEVNQRLATDSAASTAIARAFADAIPDLPALSAP